MIPCDWWEEIQVIGDRTCSWENHDREDIQSVAVKYMEVGGGVGVGGGSTLRGLKNIYELLNLRALRF